MKVIVLVAFVLHLGSAYSQVLLSCPDNECWCCPFKNGQCYNEDGRPPCCCSVQGTSPCYEGTELTGCCKIGDVCCPPKGCCPKGTVCCGQGMCCKEGSNSEHSPISGYARNLGSQDRWGKTRNVSNSECGKPNCFCCCEGLACPLKKTGSTESCIAQGKDINMYCDEMSDCPQQQSDQMFKKEIPIIPEAISGRMREKRDLERLHAIVMTSFTAIRQQFYIHQTAPRNKNFQFAVFKFGPSDSDWEPAINDAGLDWTNSLVVEDVSQNTWQASSYRNCQDGCHTEQVIINDGTISGFVHMLSYECSQMPPHILNIYSFYSPCRTGPSCQNLIQTTLSGFFIDPNFSPCNICEWQINIVWTMQYRDQTAVECNEAWGTWSADLEEDHPNVTATFGRQSIGTIV